MNQGDVELELSSKHFDCDNLRLHRFEATERMSRLYELVLDAVSIGAPLDLDAVSGADLEVVVREGDQVLRRFAGMVTRLEEKSSFGERVDRDMHPYRLVVHPTLFLATLVETLDIHLDTTLPAIIEDKLALFDLTPGAGAMLTFEHAYPKREMTVQYRETDLAFLSRLCEHWGVYYFFDHTNDQRVIFADSTDGYLPLPGDDNSVDYHERGDDQGIYQLELTRRIIPAHYVCRDYNDQTPALELQKEATLEEGFGGGVIEYGSDYRTADQGERIVKVRSEERLATERVFRGKSVDPRFAPGFVFELEGHPRHDGGFLLTEVVHRAVQPVGGWGADEGKHYDNAFLAIPSVRTFRPARVTPVPRVHGLVSGIVETAQGDLEKYAKIDDQGRYTVRFLFDTAPPGERKASCPVRMMQPLAGPNYGVHFPLKPGTEVTIAFLDGNPDRPVITGAVPNPITPTPVNAPISTKSRIKTRSGIVIEFEDANRG
ncbi:MAG TPA: type VI secretion system tip protein VgrG [Polyangiaceae bacterium]|nr:type VI secretion system tip protein VgrG [Polyangiaceae bacterium]